MVTHLTRIGNSVGVILNKKILQQAGMTSKEISIEVKDGVIIISPLAKDIQVNLDRSTWDAQFKKTIKGGNKPEKSVWPDDASLKADKDWTW